MVLLLALFCTSGVWAEDVTTEQAFEEALNFLTNRETSSSGPRRAQGIAPQIKLRGKVSGLYVFNVENDGGFVIVSNDDRTIPILGFSEKGSLDPDNMPSNMKAWLQGYADEIAWLAEHGQTTTGPKKSRQKVGSHSTAAIAPLITTTWNQGTPYNNLCPTYDDPNYGSGTCATGCVATAMAQVMKYHEWPIDATQPIPGYTSTSYRFNLPSLPAITFDWANMKYDYSGSYTADEATAVATLMQYCGYSVEMDYGPESGSNTSKVASALKEYFDYNDQTTQLVTRSYYTSANWADLIYHELANARPVVYGGQSSGGGHEFVCDGYMFDNGTDYFHINWGWGGKSDDYFVLSSLNPYAQGIGGSSSEDGFHFMQEAVIGIQKSTDNGTIADITTTDFNFITNRMTVSSPFAIVGQPVSVIINVTNNSTDDYSGDIWLGMAIEGGGYALLFANNADIPAGEAKDCVVQYTPDETGTLNFVTFFPHTDGMYYTDGVVRATVNVYENTPNNVVPVYGTWCDQDSKSQFIIPEDYMMNMQNMFIKGMTFYAEEENVSWGDAEFDVYLSEVSDATLSELMDWNTLEKVYTGSLSISSGKMKMTFDTPFEYQGGNLLVGINQTMPGSFTECTWYGTTASGASMGGSSWTEIIQQDFLPYVSFDLLATAYPEPTALAVYDITSTSAEISWNGEADSYNLRYAPYTPGAVLFSDDFENGLDQWTIVRNGEGTEDTDWHTTSATSFQDAAGTQLTNHGGNSVAVTRSWNNVEYNVDNWLITPQLDLGGKLTYWVRDGGYWHEHYDIYVSTTTNDINEFTKIYEPGNATNEWTEHTVDLSAYAGQTGYIAFRHTDADKDFLFIDDVTVIGPDEIGTYLAYENVTSPFLLSGLTASTDYRVEVQGVYGMSYSDWAGTTFTTLSSNPVPYNLAADLMADAATLTWDGEGESYNVRFRTAGYAEELFLEDFENGLDQWTVYTEGEAPGTDGWFIQSSSNIVTAFSGSHYASAWSYAANAYNANNWLVTPQLTLGKELRFWVYVNQSYPDSYEVLLSTTSNAIADFTIELQAMAPATANGAWNEVVIDLSAYTGQTGYIAIHHVDYDMNYLFIDDFGIYGNSAPAGEWQEMAAFGPFAFISGLATNNSYEYQVQSVKDGNTSEWSETSEFALLTLDNNADNTSLINIFNGMQAHVSLSGRTIYKDNTWNTICLPFDLTPAQLAASPLADADIRSFSSIAVDGTMTTLNFTSNIANTRGLLGGCPLLIKWDDNVTIGDPQFANVTILSDTWAFERNDASSGITVTFKGTYAPIVFTNEDRSILFVGAENKLYWPIAGANIGTQRAYFQIKGTTAGIKECFMDFGEDYADGISLTPALSKGEGDWYDLSGRKLAGKPSTKGIYVNGGRKVTIN